MKEINPLDFKEEIYEVYKKAVSSYLRKSYKLEIKEIFIEKMKNWKNFKVYGAFSKESKELSSYVLLIVNDSYTSFSVLKSIPKYEKMGVNAAVVSYILEEYNQKLNKNFYICDGERNILHETYFQNYLEKYFGFRKVYCKLNLEYRSIFLIIIKILFPFRNILRKINNILIFQKINSILYMEEIRKKQD